LPALTGDRVVLRPIERPDLARLWELLGDIEVAAPFSAGPVIPASLAQWEARFEQEAANPPTDQAWFVIEGEN
jgi:RimJ/RimL family protein N-acetyltransferase